jgi:hypothetical protein
MRAQPQHPTALSLVKARGQSILRQMRISGNEPSSDKPILELGHKSSSP